MQGVQNAKYHNIIISDHSPVTFSLELLEPGRNHKGWRLDPQLLNKKTFRDYLQNEINLFFETNDKDDVSPLLLWETFKAYIRGCIVSFQASGRRRSNLERSQLEAEILRLDSENAKQPSIQLHSKISSLKYKLNKLLSGKISRVFMYVKQKYFEFGDKPHKLLARQLRKRESERVIHAVRANTGSLVSSHKEINNSFRQFYKELYTSQCNVSQKIMINFLNQCNLPTLSQKDRMSLDAELTHLGLSNTIRSLKNGKSPGPDGLCNEFCKTFSNLLTPYLLKMFNKALEEGKLPQSLNEATITLIPKKGKDLEEVGSYRPISLLNSDQKILAKSLAKRLSTHMVKLVHPDQTGFIPTRHSSYNLRRLFNIIYSNRNLNEHLFILSLDAEKAFDCVEWPYLYAVLEKFGIGSNFISWIRLLYSDPCARILTNRNLSEPFKLFRGTR